MMTINKDRIFHIVLYSVVAGLCAVIIFLYYIRPNFNEELLLPNVYRLKQEQALQDVKEAPAPGSIRVPILIYHSVKPHRSSETEIVKHYDVAPESLERQLRYLRDNGYTVIAIDYLADALFQNIILPPKSVAITFDDGWENQYIYAFPLLKKYGDTATFFVVSDYIGHPFFLTWSEVKDMDQGGMAIGGHTRTHPYLPSVANDTDLENEIIGGKDIIENQLGHSINVFAYPFGDYNDQIINVVAKAGFTAARSAHYGIYQSLDDIYKLKGIEATDDFSKFVNDLNVPVQNPEAHPSQSQ